MLKDRFASLVALTLASAGPATFAMPLAAQAPQAAQETIQLAFGYECDDRFRIRNDGARAVDVEYDVQGVSERSRLHLDARQSVEISSTSRTPVELWVNGKLAATERKGDRACATMPAAPASPEVIVRPIEPRDYPAYPEAAGSYPTYPQREIVYVPEPYYYPAYSYYPPYYYPPYYPRYYGGFSVVLPIFTRIGGEHRYYGRPGYGDYFGRPGYGGGYYGRPGYGGGRFVHVARPRGGHR
ncbi:MAG TPA: hypothetical protein VHE78_05435 [Gemmatimonadaceae bacterium]|nr:hypothetical protein [Gemmatimonadaceae bacterium]